VLAERWTRRVTAIVAGAGFGKSGLVVEALAANRREPLGHDAWVGCQEEDAGIERLFEAIFTAVRGSAPPDGPLDLDGAVDRIADAVWSHSPTRVAIASTTSTCSPPARPALPSSMLWSGACRTTPTSS